MTDFIPGVTPIPASFAVITDADKQAMHAQIDKGWLTAGPVNAQFEKALSEFTGIKHVRTCNSGSSANLLAVATMVEAGYWKAGDEIITAACAFPTTVNPLLLYGLTPCFIDVDIPTYNVTVESVERAITQKTRGIMLAHTLGHPFPMAIDTMGLRVVHDMCDALGSMYGDKHVGQQGNIATCSFFPAHHITTGEGGAVFTQHDDLARILESVRDWGRSCWCQPGQENSCGRRYDFEIDGHPTDHKYLYDRLGFNLKGTEVSGACGLSQIARLPDFISARRRNFDHIFKRLSVLEGQIILPRATDGTTPSWFGFPITIVASGERRALQEYLDSNRIGSRLMFGGNITKQPYMAGRNFRISGSLENADKVLRDSLWVGLHPHLTEPMVDFMCDKIIGFFS